MYSVPVYHSPFFIVETEMKRLTLPGHHAPVRILLNGEADTVTTVGQKRLFSFNFQKPQMVMNISSV